MLKAKLVVVGGDAKSAEVRLQLPTVIGRGKEAGLTVPHGLVSRRHTEIFERDGKLFVRDLGSLNGTYVNNTRIDDEQPLEPNQLLTLGNITFRAVYEIKTDVSAEEQAAFEEVNEAAAGKNKIASMGKVVPFDETVSLDSFKKAEEKKAVAKQATLNKKLATVARPAKPNAMAERDEKAAKNPQRLPQSDGRNDVKSNKPNDDSGSEADIFSGGETEASNDATSDTDKSFVDTDSSLGSKIAIDVEVVDPANKSVLASALEELPAGQVAASFVGGIDLGEEATGPVSKIDQVEIDLGEDEKKENVEADSSLGSFLKKLPR